MSFRSPAYDFPRRADDRSVDLFTYTHLSFHRSFLVQTRSGTLHTAAVRMSDGLLFSPFLSLFPGGESFLLPPPFRQLPALEPSSTRMRLASISRLALDPRSMIPHQRLMIAEEPFVSRKERASVRHIHAMCATTARNEIFPCLPNRCLTKHHRVYSFKSLLLLKMM